MVLFFDPHLWYGNVITRRLRQAIMDIQWDFVVSEATTNPKHAMVRMADAAANGRVQRAIHTWMEQ